MRYVIPAELVKALTPADGSTSGSIEPSRSEGMNPGAASHPTYTSHKLRVMGASGMGELLSLPGDLERYSRTEPEDPRRSPVPHVISVEDVTRGLGLDQADEQRVQRLATEYSGGGVPQRLGPARTSLQTRTRMMGALRTGMRNVAPDVRDVIMRRTQALWTRENAQAAGRPPAIRYHLDTVAEKSLLYVPIDGEALLSKGVARGGRYYRRVATGKADRPYRYYYTREEYEKEHGASSHLHGPEVEERRGSSAEHYQREADKHHERAARAADARTREYHEERAGRFEALADKASTPKAEPVAEPTPVIPLIAPQYQHLVGNRLVIPTGLPLNKSQAHMEALYKSGSHKYIRRTPTGNPKRPWRYFYRESAIARDVQAGEHVRVGSELAKILGVGPDGSIHMELGGQERTVKSDEWARLHGPRFYEHAERRAAAAIKAVYKHVHPHLLEDLPTGTPEEQMAALKERAPGVYADLRRSFARAGITPTRAMGVLKEALERRGWEPAARAAMIGSLFTRPEDAKRFSQTLDGVEALSDGHNSTRVKQEHVEAHDALTTMAAVIPGPITESSVKEANAAVQEPAPRTAVEEAEAEWKAANAAAGAASEAARAAPPTAEGNALRVAVNVARVAESHAYQKLIDARTPKDSNTTAISRRSKSKADRYEVGQIVRVKRSTGGGGPDGTYFRVTKQSKYKDDDSDEWMLHAEVRPATDEEAAGPAASRDSKETRKSLLKDAEAGMEHVANDNRSVTDDAPMRIPDGSREIKPRPEDTGVIWRGLAGHSALYLGSDGAVWRSTGSYDDAHRLFRTTDPTAVAAAEALLAAQPSEAPKVIPPAPPERREEPRREEPRVVGPAAPRASERHHVRGNTYAVKDELKALGGRWHPESKTWSVPSHQREKAERLVTNAGRSRRW